MNKEMKKKADSKKLLETIHKNIELKRNGKPHTMVQDLVDLCKSGEYDMNDIKDQRKYIGTSIEFEVWGHLKQSKTMDFTVTDCVKLAQKYHFLLLTRLSKENKTPTYSQKEKTFRQYERMCKDLENGFIDDKIVDFLISLNPITAWDNDAAYKLLQENIDLFDFS